MPRQGCVRHPATTQRTPTLSPDPTTVHPLPAHDRVVFLNPLDTSPNISVGEYTSYDDPDGATDFEHRNALYASSACWPQPRCPTRNRQP